jgi:hypothetical protein
MTKELQHCIWGRSRIYASLTDCVKLRHKDLHKTLLSVCDLCATARRRLHFLFDSHISACTVKTVDILKIRNAFGQSMLKLRNTQFAIFFLSILQNTLHRRYWCKHFTETKQTKYILGKGRRGTWASEDKIPEVRATLNREGAARRPSVFVGSVATLLRSRIRSQITEIKCQQREKREK